MECKEVDRIPEGDHLWQYELKLDGYRTIRTQAGHLRHSKFLRLRDAADIRTKETVSDFRA